MNFLLLNHAIALFLTSATAFLVGFFILIKSGFEKTKLANSLWYLSVAFWSFFLGLFIIGDEPSLIILSLMWAFVLFIPVSTAHFVTSFLEIKGKDKFIKIGYILAFLFVAISFGGKMGTSFYRIGYTNAFPEVSFFVYIQVFIFLIYFLYQIIELYKAHRTSVGVRHNQIAYVFWASLLGYIGGCSNYSLAFNIYIPIFNPFATYLLLFYTLLTPLAILKYQLMDIKIVIKKALVYSVLIALVNGVILSISFLHGWIVEKIPGFQFWIVPTSIAIVTVFIGNLFYKKSQEADKLKYEFITVAAHKLRTPLTEIKWAAGALRDKKIDTAEKERLASEILSADNRLIDLTNELLSVSRAEADQHKYNLEPVNLEKIVRSVVNDFQYRLREKNIKLSYNVEKNLPKVMADQRRIGSVAQILLENAILYTKDEIKITIDVFKDNVIFHIEDNGIGISREDQTHIFSKFYRSHEAYLTETEGTGIGLFLAKSIIDKHNGKIGVRSEGKGEGSTFWFSLKAV